MGAVVVSSLAGYGMVAWALLCFRPAGLDGGADYSACDSASESYGTFQGEAALDIACLYLTRLYRLYIWTV